LPRGIHEAIQPAQRAALNDREQPLLAKFSVLVEMLAFFLIAELHANDLMAFVNSPWTLKTFTNRTCKHSQIGHANIHKSDIANIILISAVEVVAEVNWGL